MTCKQLDNLNEILLIVILILLTQIGVWIFEYYNGVIGVLYRTLAAFPSALFYPFIRNSVWKLFGIREVIE